MIRAVGSAVLICALIYIAWLRRELAAARSRGDMYRDIAAALDARHPDSRPLPSQPDSHDA